MAQRVVIPGFRKIEISGGGEGGTTNYDDLANKPSINNVPLVGNLNTVNLKLTDATLTEEGVPAEAKTVGTKLEEQSTSLTDLSRKLGNHTVKSDVPENAVFTDTIYDDTEVKESIEQLNSNLDTLAYGENAGGKNLLNPNYFTSQIIKAGGTGNIDEVSWRCDIVNNFKEDLSGISFKDNTVYTIVIYGKCQNENNTSANLIIEYTDGTNSTIRFKIKNTKSLTLFVTQGNKTISKLMFDYGSVGTDLEPKKCGIFEGVISESDFEPYIPSVKMLAEENAQHNDSISALGKCKNLLNPTLQTTTKNGITCTNNEDGTYTFNGTATAITGFNVIEWFTMPAGKYKVVGCPSGGARPNVGTGGTYSIEVNATKIGANNYFYDSGNGVDIEVENEIILRIRVENGVTLSNLVFKPMLTTDLNATYDDFVPYTGDGETLTHDVAEIKNDLSGNDKVVLPLLNNCTGELYYNKIGDLVVVNGIVNIPKANENVKVAVLPNSKVNQANAFTIYNFTDDTHDSEYAKRYASDSSLVVKVPIANKDYIISGCYIGN